MRLDWVGVAAVRESPGIFGNRAPKEQHLPVNLSGNRDRPVIRRLWKAVASGCPPTGKGARLRGRVTESLRRTDRGGGLVPVDPVVDPPDLELP